MQKETARETRVIYSRLEYLNVSTFSRQMDFSLSAFMLSTVPSAPPKVPSVILPTGAARSLRALFLDESRNDALRQVLQHVAHAFVVGGDDCD